MARIEYPDLDEARELEAAGRARRAHRTGPPRGECGERSIVSDDSSSRRRASRGNADAYYDPRNSCLNDVLVRKLGIPITLSVLTIEVGQPRGPGPSPVSACPATSS